uniref:Uncharacterized protein n=1 Tax=Nicotiana tabacum TaxID=4097 RepID=A0A1S4AAT0_TOBAC|nr:PREDICTED: uncharacterized protein LOC107795555 [Nicotiana tabacum]XP_016473702.1 PREDICTED: uncharacterized protein LOC107795555 [Nicotiana tabacum]XP_016473703.1 PREDICTED: uncharacterized protein LOC107795555 [Nicotiana tabacum]XP_016473704.1 PREDICTED: uncharacterized protein LOC107795555 [Nicotiana tabacum]XP_016473705.1 PREDICTED: uncharacterized protein LOC107795555 [Nicotiana tabacum]XP_016473707.1 PREDICTED: uncharacterized protein LOC107795555 [Nicotiana tabacum]XP_016473708.1 PR
MEPALFCKCWIGLADLLAILMLVLVNFLDSRDSTIFPIKYVVSSCTLHNNKYLIAKYAKDSSKQGATQLIYLGEKYFAAEEILFMVLTEMKEIQCQATEIAGATVGFNVVQVITKPIAAATAYGLDKNVSKGAIKKSANMVNKMSDLGFPATCFACSQLLSLYNQFNKIQSANIFLLVDKENIKPNAFTSLKMIDSKDHSYDIAEMAHIIETIQVERIKLHIHIPGVMAKHYTFGGLVEKVTPLGVQESLLIAVIKASLKLVILVLRCGNSVCISFVEAVLKILLSALHVDSMDSGSLYCILTHNLVAFSDVIQKYNYVEEATNELTIDGLSKIYFVLVHDGGFTAWNHCTVSGGWI